MMAPAAIYLSRGTFMAEGQIDKLAQVLVHYSTAVQPGNVVSLHGPPPTEPLLVALYREVLRAGGHPVVLMVPEACTETLYRHGSAAQLAFIPRLEAWEVEQADVCLHLMAGNQLPAGSPPAPAKQAIHQGARRPLRDLFLRRAAEKSLRWLAAAFPSASAARSAGMTRTAYEELVFRAGMLDREDPVAAWRLLADRQRRLIDILERGRTLRLVTPAGTDLRLGIVGRTWINGAGQDNFPDGEVFTGPVEDATEGIIHFDFPGSHGGRAVEGIHLVFHAGRVVQASAARGEDYLHALLDQDAGSTVLGEVALGCNYALERYTGNPFLDEKIGGTCHVALGASYPATGGRNESALHWDMVCDLRQGGRVEVDGKLISSDGRFLAADWPRAEV
jgi:aminopeptidase